MISIIVAIAKNRAIGKDNQLLWHLSYDLKRFKKLTEGHIVIMGQKTFESLPKKPLPNRTNIVITDDFEYEQEGVTLAYSITDSLVIAKNSNIEGEVFIIGGASIYRQFLPLADKFYITQIDKEFEGDVYFPELDESWEITDEEKKKGEEFDYSYQIWEKKKRKN